MSTWVHRRSGLTTDGSGGSTQHATVMMAVLRSKEAYGHAPIDLQEAEDVAAKAVEHGLSLSRTEGAHLLLGVGLFLAMTSLCPMWLGFLAGRDGNWFPKSGTAAAISVCGGSKAWTHPFSDLKQVSHC